MIGDLTKKSEPIIIAVSKVWVTIKFFVGNFSPSDPQIRRAAAAAKPYIAIAVAPVVAVKPTSWKYGSQFG